MVQRQNAYYTIYEGPQDYSCENNLNLIVGTQMSSQCPKESRSEKSQGDMDTLKGQLVTSLVTDTISVEVHPIPQSTMSCEDSPA